MINYKFGDIVLIAFPYSDNLEVKKRPALVLLDTGDNDFLLARITSEKYTTEYDFLINGWQKCGLIFPSTVRLHKLATLDKGLIDKKLGELANHDKLALKTKYKEMINNFDVS